MYRLKRSHNDSSDDDYLSDESPMKRLRSWHATSESSGISSEDSYPSHTNPAIHTTISRHFGEWSSDFSPTPLRRSPRTHRPPLQEVTSSYISHDSAALGVEKLDGLRRKVASLKGKGLLKLSVYVNYGMLTVHIIQAKQLEVSCRPFCNAFVKIALEPDDMHRTPFQTSVVMDTNQPHFDEKFSFELMDEDTYRRIHISVWNFDHCSGESDFLGCMSFGIRHIKHQKKVINGWYHLLTEETGKRKHLQATTQSDRRPSARGGTDSGDTVWMDTHVITVPRTGSGYGFTVSGSRPVVICAVQRGSGAERQGLQIGDHVMRVNDIDVFGATTQIVATIVRRCSRKVVLEIQRPTSCIAYKKQEPADVSSTSLADTSVQSRSGKRVERKNSFRRFLSLSVNKIKRGSPRLKAKKT